MSVTLGIDIGTSGTKTIAIDESGAILASDSAEYPCEHPQPGWSEQDPDLWWRATASTVRGVLAKGNLKAGDIAAVGLSGQMHGSVFLDAEGKVVRPALLWNDQRTVAEAAEIEEKAGGREGLVRLVANRALVGFTAPKVLWLRNREPSHFDRVRQILLPKDYIRFQALGHLCHRGQRRLGHPVPRRRQPSMVQGAARAARPRPELAARVLRELRGLLGRQPIRGRGDGLEGRDEDRRRRRRPAGRRGGQRDRPRRGGLGHDGDLRRGLRPRRASPASTPWAGSSAAATPCRGPGA